MQRLRWPRRVASKWPARCWWLLLASLQPDVLRAQDVASIVIHPVALPNAPGAVLLQAFASSPQIQPSPISLATATITGLVLDVDGAEIAGAKVVLEDTHSGETHTSKSNEEGTFSFIDLSPGTYKVTVTSEGFAAWTATDVLIHPGEAFQLPQIALEIASVNSSVDAIFSTYEIAEDQVRAEEKQRVLGIVPNFYVVYDWHASPLTAGQKFRLALRVERDPFTFIGSGVVAGIEQATNTFPGYGQGAAGFGKRYAASLADGFDGTLIGGAILPSLLHQDPRYFYKGTGSITSRALYAIATVVICKGDNGRWQPNYSSILGDLAAAGISNAYYPASDRRGAAVVIDNSLIGTAEGAVSSLLQEFFLKHISAGIPRRTPPNP